jgi:hypothetical protein
MLSISIVDLDNSLDVFTMSRLNYCAMLTYNPCKISSNVCDKIKSKSLSAFAFSYIFFYHKMIILGVNLNILHSLVTSNVWGNFNIYFSFLLMLVISTLVVCCTHVFLVASINWRSAIISS